MLEGLRRSLSFFEIETRAEFPKRVRRERQLFGGALGLPRSVRAAQFVMRARRTITIPQQIKDGNAASEVLCGRIRVGSGHFQQSTYPLRFASHQQVGRRVGYQFRQAPKICAAFLFFATFKECFSQKEARFADRLPITDLIGKFQSVFRSRQRVSPLVHCEIVTAECAEYLTFVPFVPTFTCQSYCPI